MSDISQILPEFDLKPYRHLTYSLEKNDVTVAELIALDPVEIAKRCPLPLGDLKVMIHDVIQAIQNEMGLRPNQPNTRGELLSNGQQVEKQANYTATGKQVEASVMVLDTKIDQCLAGGFRTGYVTEIVGESAVGKTQFVLGLLLSVQLSPPHGLGKSAIYLSTEAPLNTMRLQQMLYSHPAYEELSLEERPSLDRVHTVSTNDLDTQERIIRHQLPLAIERFQAGLVVMDSVAANFRAEHDTKNAKGLADRAADLTRLGNMLRDIAREYNVAVVVTNQVSDRFDDVGTALDRIRSSSPAIASSPLPGLKSQPVGRFTGPDQIMTLDHQQRFFTGWGDQPTMWYEELKTPALGLSWANQLSARIVLKVGSERVNRRPQDYLGGNIWKDKKKRRYVGVVFAPWVAPTYELIEYEITSQGIVAVSETATTIDGDGEDGTMLDPKLWFDGAVEDDEFP